MNPLAMMQVDAKLAPLLWECDDRMAGETLTGWVEAGLAVRLVRGRKMRSRQALFDEVSAALQFPAYFGENADAFDECIADLGWLSPQAGYVMVITDPDEVLAEEDTAAFKWFISSLSRACEELASPVQLGEWWDRPGVPFHVVLMVEQGRTAARWSGVGV